MAGPISYLDVELRAKAGQYNAEMQQAERRSRSYGNAAKQATTQTKGLSTGLTHATGALGRMGGPIGNVTGLLGDMSTGLGASALLWTSLGAAVGGVTAIMSGSMSVYSEVERRQAKTEALLRATGNSAGFAGFELDSMARSVALATLASTDDIREAQDVLLTFRSVRGKVFEETIGLSQDLAVVMGGTAKTAALQLGKALEDPVTGMTALRRSGVSFTEAEKELVKQLMDANRVLEAQELILKKVKDQVGGAGAGEASGLAGAVDTLGQRWDETLEKIGRTSGITNTAGTALNTLSEALLGWQYLIDPKNTNGQKYFDELFAERMQLIERLRNAGNPDDLMAMPMPGVYDKNDWYDDQRRLSEVDTELKALRDANVEQQKKAAAARAASEATAQAAEEEKKAADEAERRAKALEEIAKQQAKATAGGDLWNDIFGIKEPKRKTDGPVEKNYAFRNATRAADARIKDGDAVNAKAWIDQMVGAYESAMRDQNHNYDVSGMEQIIKKMKLLATAEFGDLDKAAAKEKTEGLASLDVQGMGHSISLMGDSSVKLTESVNKLLGIDTTSGLAEITRNGKTTRFHGATPDDVADEYERQRNKAEAMNNGKAPETKTLTLKVQTDQGGEDSANVQGTDAEINKVINMFTQASLAAR